ncbi:Na(+) H(+) antiporter subunit A [hydrothermal vent metagenome]|uniref:Na(+) H(+) antiporter subunit A n=1 Tax=hydrothermal vent metagenome TaxID=652676 RepID=A0A3B0VJG9_9ZZZZ
MAMFYVLFSAPDVAMTQFAIETLTVVLFVLVLYRLPYFNQFTNKLTRQRDALIALASGGLMTALVLTVTAIPTERRLTSFFAENSLTLAKGRNIVNVILVDFRGLDTLGELTVLAVAGIGVFALLKAARKD